MMNLMIRLDVRLPTNAVDLVVKNLINDSLAIRKMAISALAAILKQQSRPHKKVELSSTSIIELNGVVQECSQQELVLLALNERVNSRDLGTNDSSKVGRIACIPGYRPDNSWLQYQQKNIPRDKEAWDKTLFVDKVYYGFYGWPR